jgi:hypothetical protein
MARNSKYDWPDDQTLQALLDELGTVETARQVGCPPRSLSNRIRRRGLRASKQGKPDAANGNGQPEAGQSDGEPAVATANGEPRAAQSKEKPGAADSNGERAEEPDGERKLGSRIWEVLLARPDKEPGRERNTSKAPVREPKTSEPVQESKQSEPVEESKPSEEPGAFGNDDSPSAQRAFRLEHPFALVRRVPPPIWRLLAVVGLAAVAAAAAFISVGNDPKTYQRESSFAVRPSSDVPPASVNDVLGTLAQPDSAITETIVNMLGSPRLRNFAARSAGIPASSVGGSGAEYEWSATRRTGSTIIDVRLTGPNDDKLLAMQTAAAPEAARLVEESYSPYRLETLSAPSPPVQVGPKTARTVGLALLLGGLLGVTLVLVERRLRSSLAQREGPARAPAERGESWGR